MQSPVQRDELAEDRARHVIEGRKVEDDARVGVFLQEREQRFAHLFDIVFVGELGAHERHDHRAFVFDAGEMSRASGGDNRHGCASR